LESDVRSNVGYGVLTGLVILTLSFVDPDPTRNENHINPIAGVHVLSLRFDAFGGRAGGNVVK
jgi:hypothetical protein